MKKTLFILIFIITYFTGSSQISGIWEGHLKVSKTDSLSMVVVVEQLGDSLVVELDSPDQYSFHIQPNAAAFSNDTFSFTIKSLNASFVGVYNNVGDVIAGVFTQNRRDFPMVLARIAERIIPKRPQTPQPPYPYNVDEKIIYHENNTPTIFGTLTWPLTGKPKAVVVLISGSGWQDRDETMFLHKPFLIIADYLTKLGYAVFRYDDLPMPKFRNATTLDFSKYAGMILDSLKNDTRCADVPIGFLGHSEGSLVATMCASVRKDVAFIISLAGPSIPLYEILVYQAVIAAKNADFSNEEIRNSEKMNRDFYQIVKKSKTSQKAVAAIDQWFHNIANTMNDAERERYGFSNSRLIMLKQNVVNPWMYAFIKCDPTSYIKKCNTPFLALNGSLDMQVEAQPNLSAFERHLKKDPRNRFIEFSNLNHLFQEAQTGSMDEYGKIEQTISPEVLEAIRNWLELEK
ncbi:alpha/beta hydrolase [Bacteroidales bacterium OttesenSCG-928-B11]|nr:alpha/beta hydrolase [Bacteroidales bacterium OttesenSCG-928-B11]MDL2326692.1 alpha/beta hydrolase [Bacteroidales bacterium OttesenSCG-928-A14]